MAEVFMGMLLGAYVVQTPAMTGAITVIALLMIVSVVPGLIFFLDMAAVMSMSNWLVADGCSRRTFLKASVFSAGTAALWLYCAQLWIAWVAVHYPPPEVYEPKEPNPTFIIIGIGGIATAAIILALAVYTVCMAGETLMDWLSADGWSRRTLAKNAAVWGSLVLIGVSWHYRLRPQLEAAAFARHAKAAGAS